jgi:hypothetical protein
MFINIYNYVSMIYIVFIGLKCIINMLNNVIFDSVCLLLI